MVHTSTNLSSNRERSNPSWVCCTGVGNDGRTRWSSGTATRVRSRPLRWTLTHSVVLTPKNLRTHPNPLYHHQTFTRSQRRHKNLINQTCVQHY